MIYSILIHRYSWEQNRSWRFEHSFFMPDPLRGDFNIAGLNFQWGEEGIIDESKSPNYLLNLLTLSTYLQVFSG